MPFEPPFQIGHLHKGEQDRIRNGDLNPTEREMLGKGEDPWAKFRGPEKEPPPTPVPSGTGQDRTETESPGERQPTDDELLRFMSPKTRLWWDRPNLTPQDRARIWQGNKKLYFAAQKARAETDKSETTKPDLRELEGAVDRAKKVMGEAAEILRRKAEKQSSTQPELLPRWLDRFRWFRWLRTHPKISGGGGLALTFAIFLKGIDWQIDGAVKSAASAFLAAWVVLAIVIYVSSVWDKRQPVMSIVWVAAGVLMAFIWWAYLPPPPQPTLTPSTIQVNPAPAASPAADRATQPIAQPSVANAEERIPLDIAPEKLVDFFQRYNEAQAEGLVQPYLGKWLEISGSVVEVSRELLEPREGERGIRYGIEVALETRTSNKTKPRVVTYAIFEEQRWTDRALVLKRNEHIRVRGQIRRISSFGFTLERCEIIE